MPSIEIPESLFARLQELAVPLVDTPVTVIERLLSSYAGQKTRQTSATVEPVQAGASDQKAARMGQPQREFESNAAPSLRHTRVISAEFAGNRANGWNDLVRVAHIEALRRLGSLEAVRRITTSKMILGRANSEQEKKGLSLHCRNERVRPERRRGTLLGEHVSFGQDVESSGRGRFRVAA